MFTKMFTSAWAKKKEFSNDKKFSLISRTKITGRENVWEHAHSKQFDNLDWG